MASHGVKSRPSSLMKNSTGGKRERTADEETFQGKEDSDGRGLLRGKGNCLMDPTKVQFIPSLKAVENTSHEKGGKSTWERGARTMGRAERGESAARRNHVRDAAKKKLKKKGKPQERLSKTSASHRKKSSHKRMEWPEEKRGPLSGGRERGKLHPQESRKGTKKKPGGDTKGKEAGGAQILKRERAKEGGSCNLDAPTTGEIRIMEGQSGHDSGRRESQREEGCRRGGKNLRVGPETNSTDEERRAARAGVRS